MSGVEDLFTPAELAQLAAQSRTGTLGRYFVALRTADGPKLLYAAQPRQDELHGCAAPNIMYGGQAGGGKSHSLRWHGIMACLRTPGLKVLLLRRQFKDLEQTHLLKLPEELAAIYEAGAAEYVDNKHRLTFTHPGKADSVIQFGHCETDKNIAGYLSTEWDMILVDEGSHFRPRHLAMLRSRLRTKIPGIRPQFIVGTNPGGEAHLWLKARFITKSPPADEERNYKPDRWAFIASALEDNLYLDSEEYDQQFSSMTKAEYRAYRQGDWDAFAGQYFTEWSRAVHVLPIERLHLEEWFEVVGGMDWGYSPGVGIVYWCAFDQYGRGQLYRELVFKECTPQEVALQLWERCETPAERRMIVQGDTSMWTPQAKQGGVSIAQEINEELGRLAAAEGAAECPVLVQATKDRMNGWARVHQFLKPVRKQPETGELGPWLRIVAPDPETGLGCPYLIDTLPAQVHDDQQTGDMKKGATDHGADALRYLLMAREPLSEVPVVTPSAVKARKDGRAFHRRMVLAALRRANEERLARDEDEGELPLELEHPDLEELEGETSTDLEALWS